MRLATYSPDVTRLRRVAKACAAGELSRSEYRLARRQVIENLARPASCRDDTVPRFDADTTVRRSADPEVTTSSNNNRLNVLWLLLLMVVLGALTVPGVAHSQVSASQVIPPVKERPADPNNSPRYDVNKVVWSVPEEWPRMPLQEVQPLLDRALGQANEVYRVDNNGFTQGELEEVARFLNAVGIHDAAVRPSREDISDLKALVERQKSRRHISLAQLEGIAEQLEKWVKNQGYPLASVFVPAQTIRDGVVELRVLLGTLSEVEVSSIGATADLKKNAYWMSQLSDLVGHPVRKSTLESRLNLVNRAAAETVQASFAPGVEVGETKLTMLLTPAKRFFGAVQIDNHGLAAFGDERISYTGVAPSVLRSGDRLDVGFSSALGGEDHIRGKLRYTLPWASQQLTLSGGVAVSDLEWRQDVSGEGKLFDFSAIQTFNFTRTERREIKYRVGWQDYEWNAQGYPDQRVWFVGADAQGHQRWDAEKISLEVSAGLTVGGVDEPTPQQDDQFAKVSGRLFGWTLLEHFGAKAVLKSRFQWSGDHLPAAQKIALSHAHANPGVEPFSQTVDSLLEIGGEVHFDATIGSWWLFAEAGFGQDNNRADTWYQLATVGLGWQAQLLTTDVGRLSGRVTLGHPLVHKSNGDFWDDGTQVFFALRFNH